MYFSLTVMWLTIAELGIALVIAIQLWADMGVGHHVNIGWGRGSSICRLGRHCMVSAC